MKSNSRQTLEQILASVAESGHYIGVDPKTMTVHTREPSGDTPLHIMAMRGDRHALQLLLDAGAEVNALGDMSCTPLYLAVTYKHTSCVELLLGCGANPDTVSELGYTPRTLAIAQGDREVERLFKQSPTNRSMRSRRSGAPHER
jgi:ankyrin repeat protein